MLDSSAGLARVTGYRGRTHSRAQQCRARAIGRLTLRNICWLCGFLRMLHAVYVVEPTSSGCAALGRDRNDPSPKTVG